MRVKNCFVFEDEKKSPNIISKILLKMVATNKQNLFARRMVFQIQSNFWLVQSQLDD